MNRKSFRFPVWRASIHLVNALIMAIGLIAPMRPSHYAEAQIDYSHCVSLVPGFYTVPEDGIIPTQRIIELHSSSTPDCWISVTAFELTINTREDTALADVDFVPLNLNLSLTQTDFVNQIYSFPVTILPDMIAEFREWFWVEISHAVLVFDDGTQQPISLPSYQTSLAVEILNYRPSEPFLLMNPTPVEGEIALRTSEDGTAVTIETWLASAPTVAVTVSAWICGGPSRPCLQAEASISPSSHTFTSANYNIPQTFIVTGLDDPLFESGVNNGDKLYFVYFRLNYPGSVYDQVTVILVGVNLDNDTTTSTEIPPTETPPIVPPTEVPPIEPPTLPSTDSSLPVDTSNPNLQPYLLGTRLFVMDADTPLMAYDAPQGQPISFNGDTLLLPFDNDYNGYDTYIIYGVLQIEDETWVALRLSDHAVVWVVLP